MRTEIPKSRVTRTKQTMPVDIRHALEDNDLMAAYEARPPYQRNDYLGWIARAVREATRQKRLDQMLRELKLGDVYMNMAWSAPSTGGSRPPKGAARA